MDSNILELTPATVDAPIASEPTPAVTRIKKTKTPVVKEAYRTIDELDTIDAKKMTPTECILYINACRDTLNMQNNKITELKATCTKAFEQFRNADDAYKKLKADSDKRLRFCEQAISVCHESIKMQGGTR